MYHKDIFRKQICGYEKRYSPCEYLIICPFKHSTDEYDSVNNITYNKASINYYTQSLKNKVLQELEKIKLLQNVLDYHKCFICKGELIKVYNITECCNKILCQKCALISPLPCQNSKICKLGKGKIEEINLK